MKKKKRLFRILSISIACLVMVCVFGLVVSADDSTSKTYDMYFTNNSNEYSSVTVTGTTNSSGVFTAISTIKYDDTTVYSAGTWTTGYSSTLGYGNVASLNVNQLNHDCNEIVTFTTSYTYDKSVLTTIISVVTSLITLVAANPLLILWAVAVPVCAIGGTFLFKLIRRV